MSIINHLHDNDKYEQECPFCHHKFHYRIEYQTPGFRMKDTLYCPKCKKAITSSMEVEFHIYERTK